MIYGTINFSVFDCNKIVYKEVLFLYIWNKLPNSFRTCGPLKEFKTKIATWSIGM